MPGYELIDRKERKEILHVMDKSKILCRQGFENIRKKIFKVQEFENKFKNYFKSKYALGVTSGTSALRVALATLNLKPDDEIITQSFTFVATVEAIVEARAIPICLNIDETLNLDPDELKKKINKKTKAVIVVHMLGVPAKILEIRKICKERSIILIEDTAWGCGATVNKKFLGTFGDIGTFSFDAAKTLTTGEGGMIIFRNKKNYKLAKAWHDHGHENNPKLNRWEDSRSSSGFNYRMNELQAAVGIAQLKKLKKIVKIQNNNLKVIWKSIKNIKGLKRRYEIPNSLPSADALIIIVKNKEVALKCRKELLKQGVSTKILPEAYSWHFAKTWDHIPELWDKKKNLKKNLNISKKILERCVSIPIFIKQKKIFSKKIRMAFMKIEKELQK